MKIGKCKVQILRRKNIHFQTLRNREEMTAKMISLDKADD
jgi:hypothetical protein